MLRYFIAGNLWLLFAIVMFLGRKAWRTGPVRYTFFGAGSLSPLQYNLLILCCIGLAAAFFIITWKTRESK
jgi:hypothetical protein